MYTCFNERWEGRKKEASKVKQTTRQSSIAHSLFLRKMSYLGWAYSRQSALSLSYQGGSAGWAQISHLIVHLMNRLTINSVWSIYMYMYMYMFVYWAHEWYAHSAIAYIYIYTLSVSEWTPPTVWRNLSLSLAWSRLSLDSESAQTHVHTYTHYSVDLLLNVLPQDYSSSTILQFFRVLSLCHTVIPEWNEDSSKVAYMASSPGTCIIHVYMYTCCCLYDHTLYICTLYMYVI